jgi:hypothetical protein
VPLPAIAARYNGSNTSGRFGADGDLPGHHALAEWRDRAVDRDAEFEADLADLGQVIRSVAIRP